MVKSEPVPCSREEMDRLIQASLDNQFFYTLFSVAKTTGRRLGELYGNQKRIADQVNIIGHKPAYDSEGNKISLAITRTKFKKIPNEWEGGVKVKDIDFNNGIMKIWVLKRGKPMQDESILIKDVANLLKAYVISKKLKEDDFVFRELSYRQIQNKVSIYGKKAKIPHKVMFHNFRHYFVTELKRKGWSNDKIAKLTGHKSIEVLRIYDHIVASDIKEEALKDLKDL
jgi:integrase